MFRTLAKREEHERAFQNRHEGAWAIAARQRWPTAQTNRAFVALIPGHPTAGTRFEMPSS